MAGSWRAIVIGGSAGATSVIVDVLAPLRPGFPLPIVVCSHLHAADDGAHARYIASRSGLEVVEAQDKQALEPGVVHVAPADYHLLIERDGSLALSTAAKVHWSRPSIDVLFESAAYAFTTALVGILLSGASEDGAAGLRAIRDLGGHTIAQDPATAKHPEMPQAAIRSLAAAVVASPPEIERFAATLQR